MDAKWAYFHQKCSCLFFFPGLISVSDSHLTPDRVEHPGDFKPIHLSTYSWGSPNLPFINLQSNLEHDYIMNNYIMNDYIMSPRSQKKIETFWNRCPTVQRVVNADRIHDITYHISSSPYYSECMHTKYTLILPETIVEYTHTLTLQ